jgi:neuropeptide FF receptor 2
MENYVAVFFILILIAGIIGLVGNVIVIIVYVLDDKLRSFTTYFFVNLSIVDIGIVLLCLPLGLLDMYNSHWILGKFVCHVSFFVESVFISVSSLTLIAISLERLFAIQKPLEVRKIVNKTNLSIF